MFILFAPIINPYAFILGLRWPTEINKNCQSAWNFQTQGNGHILATSDNCTFIKGKAQ